MRPEDSFWRPVSSGSSLRRALENRSSVTGQAKARAVLYALGSWKLVHVLVHVRSGLLCIRVQRGAAHISRLVIR
jgi:hypothetical protein